jgi:hypothetical protein
MISDRLRSLNRRLLFAPVVAMAVASCGGSMGGTAVPPSEVSAPPAACLSVAGDDRGTEVAFFPSTVGAIRRLPAASASEDLAAHDDSKQATLCYIDGAIPKGPPPPPSGTTPPSFDRAVVVVVGQDAITVAAGYRQNLAIQAP